MLKSPPHPSPSQEGLFMFTGLENGKHEAFLRVKEVAALLGIGVSTWWQWTANGKAPQGIKLGSRITVWRLSQVMALVARLENASREAQL